MPYDKYKNPLLNKVDEIFDYPGNKTETANLLTSPQQEGERLRLFSHSGGKPKLDVEDIGPAGKAFSAKAIENFHGPDAPFKPPYTLEKIENMYKEFEKWDEDLKGKVGSPERAEWDAYWQGVKENETNKLPSGYEDRDKWIQDLQQQVLNAYRFKIISNANFVPQQQDKAKFDALNFRARDFFQSVSKYKRNKDPSETYDHLKKGATEKFTSEFREIMKNVGPNGKSPDAPRVFDGLNALFARKEAEYVGVKEAYHIMQENEDFKQFVENLPKSLDDETIVEMQKFNGLENFVKILPEETKKALLAKMNEPGKDGMTPLQRAAQQGKMDEVQRLIKVGVDPFVRTTHYKRSWGMFFKDLSNFKFKKPARTASEIAALHNHSEVRQVILAGKPDEPLVTSQDIMDWTNPELLQAVRGFSAKEFSEENMDFIFEVGKLKVAKEQYEDAIKNNLEQTDPAAFNNLKGSYENQIASIEDEFIGANAKHQINIKGETATKLTGADRILAAELEIKALVIRDTFPRFKRDKEFNCAGKFKTTSQAVEAGYAASYAKKERAQEKDLIIPPAPTLEGLVEKLKSVEEELVVAPPPPKESMAPSSDEPKKDPEKDPEKDPVVFHSDEPKQVSAFEKARNHFRELEKANAALPPKQSSTKLK